MRVFCHPESITTARTGARLVPEIFQALSSIGWVLLRTIHSNALCVSCLALVVWLIVLMSWRWRNRCSLPKYLFLSSCILVSFIRSMYSFHPSLSLHLARLFLSQPLLVSLTFSIPGLSGQLLPSFLYPSLPSCSECLPLIFPAVPHLTTLSIALLVFPFFSISYPLWIRIPPFNALNHRSL